MAIKNQCYPRIKKKKCGGGGGGGGGGLSTFKLLIPWHMLILLSCAGRKEGCSNQKGGNTGNINYVSQVVAAVRNAFNIVF